MVAAASEDTVCIAPAHVICQHHKLAQGLRTNTISSFFMTSLHLGCTCGVSVREY